MYNNSRYDDNNGPTLIHADYIYLKNEKGKPYNKDLPLFKMLWFINIILEMNYPAAELRGIFAMRSLQIISAVHGISVYRFFRGL